MTLDAMSPWLPYFWACLIAFSILVYIIVDGYDLGAAILFATAKSDEERNTVIGAIAPFWDGNETWLIIVGACLFGAFPAIYAIFLSAFYLPVVLLLIGLIFRGVAFEYREQALKARGIWEWGFVIGSAVATIVQGAAIGTLILGLPIDGTTYVGNGWDWLAPFPVLCGVGLVLGYSMLGAGWLILKTEGVVAKRARAQLRALSIAFSVFVLIAFLITQDVDLPVRQAWENAPIWHFLVPLLGFVGLFGAFRTSRHDCPHERAPFAWCMLIIASAFGSLALSFWPYMMPYSLTIEQAAAPAASLQFMFWGAIIMFPLVVYYFLRVYHMFSGKTDPVGYGVNN
jgi:cytochrome bd ubiquinol oxidase subunit II